MKNNIFLLLLLVIAYHGSIKAQQTQTLSLNEAIQLALKNSSEAKLAETKVQTANAELKVVKNHQYPDFKISGQYQYLTNADIKTHLASDNDTGETPKVNQLLLGQATASLPLFSGFKLKNLVEAGKNNLQAAQYASRGDKEQLVMQTIADYIDLYKANRTVVLVKENLKTAHQRVIDFEAMEQNGLLARNDLLKAQLQESNIALTLEEAKKNLNILNYKLSVLLKLPEGTNIQTIENSFSIASNTVETDSINRSDLAALQYQEKAAKNQVKVAQSNYYPSISLTGGYVALDLKNAITVTNAMNFGVGISYNIANLFKNKSDVKVAKSKVSELNHAIDIATDKIHIQIKKAKQDYTLTLKKYDVYIKSEQQATENYRIVKDKYDNGLVDTNDLLEADVDQLQSEINLAYAKANIAQKYYELLNAQGQLNTEIQ